MSTRFLKIAVITFTLFAISSAYAVVFSVITASPDYSRGTFFLILAVIFGRGVIAALDSIEIRRSTEARLAARYGETKIERVG